MLCFDEDSGLVSDSPEGERFFAEDGKPAKAPREKRIPVKADEVLAVRDYGTHVVVVTRDGQKLSSLGQDE